MRSNEENSPAAATPERCVPPADDSAPARPQDVQQRHLASIVESSDDAILAKTLDGIITSWNRAAAKMYGYTAEEILGKHVSILAPPEQRQEIDDIMQRIRMGERIAHHETTRITKDGRRIEISLVVSPIHDASGNVIGASAIGRDITQRKQLEAALCESEQRFRVITDSSPAIMWKTSPQGQAMYLNARWEEITGVPIPHALGDGWHTVIHPDDQERCAAAVQMAHTSGEPYQLEVRYRCRGGTFRWFLVRAVPLVDARGQITEWLGTSFDIHDRKVAEAEREQLLAVAEATQAALQESQQRLEDRVRERTEELRRSEERYRELFENANDAIFTTDLDGRITSVNRAAERITGYTREEFLKKNVIDVLVPEDHPRIMDKRQDRLRHGGITQYQVSVIAKNGNLIPAEISTRLIMESGRPVGIQGIARDITERKQTEEVLRQVSARLMELRDEERRRFARELHDSTGQNLAALMMNLSLIAANNGVLDPEMHRTIKESLALADSCAREIRTISYLLHPPLLDEMGLESALNWLADGFAERSGVRVDLKVSAGRERLPREVELAIFRVVQESLTNIHRHSGSRSAVIRVTRGQDFIELSVADQGSGIAGWKNSAPDWSRAGVGIAGMRERVALLGGKLEIDSGAAGTTISARLPLAKAAAAAAGM